MNGTGHKFCLCGVNTESILMSWEIGAFISARLKSNEWGSNYEAYSTPAFLETEKKLLEIK